MYPARPLRKTLQILLTGPPGQAKTLFSRCIFQGFGKNKEFFTVGGNASKSGMIEVLFDMRPTYLLVDEIERGIVLGIRKSNHEAIIIKRKEEIS